MFDAEVTIGSGSGQVAPAVACSTCSNITHCVSVGLTRAQLEEFDQILGRERSFRAGEPVFRMEDPFTSLHVVRRGSLKVEVITADGIRHVTGFYYPGDLVAVESIGTDRYASDCIALEDTVICRIPYDPFLRLTASAPALVQQFANQLSKRIRTVNQNNIHRRSFPAERRLFEFLCQFCAKTRAKRVTSECVNVRLPMSKGDIASYLGIVPESLSRAFAALERQGFVQRDRDHVKLIRLADDCHD